MGKYSTLTLLFLEQHDSKCYDACMIRQISGEVLLTGPTSIVVEVSGFGIEVRVSNPETFSTGREATLATHLAVKQDGLELYGFSNAADRDFFELILSVSGIGPKTAISALKRSTREALAGAIGKRDLTYLTKVVGLGKKSAEKMLVELSDKVDATTHSDDDAEVFDTLVALGYTDREARAALRAIPAEVTGKEPRLKAALSTAR